MRPARGLEREPQAKQRDSPMGYQKDICTPGGCMFFIMKKLDPYTNFAKSLESVFILR